MSKKYRRNKNNNVQKTKKKVDYDINKISVPSAAANREMIACESLKRMISDIKTSKERGEQTVHILGVGHDELPPKEAIEKIHEAGYDLFFSHWDHNSSWSITADWQPGHNGSIFLKKSCGIGNYYNQIITLDEIYEMDLRGRGKMDEVNEAAEQE